MQITDRNIFVVPLEDSTIQVVVVPQSSIRSDLQSLSLSDQVKRLLTDIKDDSIKKIRSLSLPSFRVETKGDKINELTNLNLGTEQHVADANSASIVQLGSGIQTRGGLKPQPEKAGEDFVITEPFIFAINDQELELLQAD